MEGVERESAGHEDERSEWGARARRWEGGATGSRKCELVVKERPRGGMQTRAACSRAALRRSGGTPFLKFEKMG